MPTAATMPCKITNLTSREKNGYKFYEAHVTVEESKVVDLDEESFDLLNKHGSQLAELPITFGTRPGNNGGTFETLRCRADALKGYLTRLTQNRAPAQHTQQARA